MNKGHLLITISSINTLKSNTFRHILGILLHSTAAASRRRRYETYLACLSKTTSNVVYE